MLNVYIVIELYDYPKVTLRKFTLENCLFGAPNIVQNNNNDKWVFSGYGIAFDGGDWWSFGNGTARNVITFDVDNSSSSNIDNLKNNFLILGLHFFLISTMFISIPSLCFVKKKKKKDMLSIFTSLWSFC